MDGHASGIVEAGGLDGCEVDEGGDQGFAFIGGDWCFVGRPECVIGSGGVSVRKLVANGEGIRQGRQNNAPGYAPEGVCPALSREDAHAGRGCNTFIFLVCSALAATQASPPLLPGPAITKTDFSNLFFLITLTANAATASPADCISDFSGWDFKCRASICRVSLTEYKYVMFVIMGLA